MSASDSKPGASYALAARFFDELARSGVRHVCVSPGSRSAPLAVCAARCEALRTWVHVDERSGAFFALGLAKASREPVALVCTSGTAVANFLPAVVEAHYAGVPLIVLSADRPAELREWGAGQTIDQSRIFGSHLRWFAELPTPDGSGEELLRHGGMLACRAVAEATGSPPGPVHLNWPLREPLDPAWELAGEAAESVALASELQRAEGRAYTEIGRSRVPPQDAQVAELVELARGRPRGLIACGPMDADAELCESVAALARAAGWPVLADPCSQLRAGAHVAGAPILATGDLILRDAAFARAHAPDVVLRIGGSPVSKAFRLWLEARPPEHLLLVDPAGAWNDPSHLATQHWSVDPALLCRRAAEGLGGSRESAWLADFEAAEGAAARAVDRGLGDESRLFEPRAVRELCARLPDDAILYVSNSMPVRDLDAVMPLAELGPRVLSNRGANGIDGMVSSALGAAAAGVGPAVLLTGDLALLHDLGGLLAARRHGLRGTIVVLNNDGGGIFSFLPIAQHGESVHFEELFTTPHGVDLRPA
ncbi:MAG: 2-succinyl-5-enolpyruvyl-6-hydroxy-3-cyclohexene-1-carboxylic-acid synthase, partial [Deltaproteobacteria bacterium]|nr:2-succinyl-5-enolpyruvyl-6-hydroxy-3-cyclohexene-1-carboxylic-acid synthase [Deltaproteobacteria bacterium]